MRKLQLLLLATVALANAYAQKLPNVQLQSVRAPTIAKIDGKPIEWSKMQAYNPAAEVFYTIANDDKKLYLIVQCTGRDMMLRLVNGGVTLLVQPSGKKTDVGAVGAKFPFIQKGHNIGIAQGEEYANGQKIDVTTSYKGVSVGVKWIYTKGLLGKDSIVSKYNDAGIEGAVAIDTKRVYTSEMAIDLRLLGLPIVSNAKFAYHIIVNGEPNKYGNVYDPEKWHVLVKEGEPQPNEAQIQAGKQMIQKSFASASATTDFWGEYILAK